MFTNIAEFLSLCGTVGNMVSPKAWLINATSTFFQQCRKRLLGFKGPASGTFNFIPGISLKGKGFQFGCTFLPFTANRTVFSLFRI